jgi:hypothetical protein
MGTDAKTSSEFGKAMMGFKSLARVSGLQPKAPFLGSRNSITYAHML